MVTTVIGVTGGIGSGKSAATDYFATQGIDIVDADVVARQVVAPGESALAAITERFGNTIVDANGELDRAALRAIVFSDEQQKLWLNKLLHPIIRQRILDQLDGASSPYGILVAPLLLENGLERYCQRVLVIDVPEHLQITRTAQRDQVDAEQVSAIIDSQLDRNARLSKADDVVQNDGSLAHLHQQLAELHQRYLKLANH